MKHSLVWALLLLTTGACSGQALDAGNTTSDTSLGDGGSEAGPPPATASPACAAFAIAAPGAAAQPGTGCVCSRRGPLDVGCTPGAGQSTTVVIGASGGTVSLTGQQGATSGTPFDLTIPPGALTADTTITVTETSLAPPAGFSDWSPIYRIDPVDLELAAPARLNVPISNASTAMNDANLGVFASASGDPCTLAPLPGSYLNAGFEQVMLEHLGGYLVAGYAHTGAAPVCP